MSSPTIYYVWRRNDGYVNATAGRCPRDYKTTAGDPITFEHLGQFDVWDDKIVDFIEKCRND